MGRGKIESNFPGFRATFRCLLPLFLNFFLSFFFLFFTNRFKCFMANGQKFIAGNLQMYPGGREGQQEEGNHRDLKWLPLLVKREKGQQEEERKREKREGNHMNHACDTNSTKWRFRRPIRSLRTNPLPPWNPTHPSCPALSHTHTHTLCSSATSRSAINHSASQKYVFRL